MMQPQNRTIKIAPESLEPRMADDGPGDERRVTLPTRSKQKEARRETAKVTRIPENGFEAEPRMRSVLPPPKTRSSHTSKGK